MEIREKSSEGPIVWTRGHNSKKVANPERKMDIRCIWLTDQGLSYKQNFRSWDHVRSPDSVRCILGLWDKAGEHARRTEKNQKLSCCNP